MTAHRRLLSFGLLAAGIAAVQILTTLAGKTYYLTQLTMSGYYTVVVLGLCLLMGYAGQASLGQAGFFAIGGYFTAFLTTFDLASRGDREFVSLLGALHLLQSRTDAYGTTIVHVDPRVALIVAVGLAGLTAWLIAGPVFRLRGHYLAMATLGFGIIVHRLFVGSGLFGGADGISDVPPLTLFAGFAISGRSTVRVANYYAAWTVVVLTLWMLFNLIDSRVGRALRAMHGSENAAAAVGIPIARYKTRTFVLAAVLAALAGALLTYYNGGIGPSEASVTKSVRYVAIVAVGGMANLVGSLTMSTLLNFLSLRGYFGTYDDLVFGVILVVMMLFLPEGVVGGRSPLRRLRAAIVRFREGGGGTAA